MRLTARMFGSERAGDPGLSYPCSMAALGALSQAWTSAEASLPLGWQLSGLYHFDEL